MNPALYTVGHSTHGADYFCALLLRRGVTVLCDVRSHPASARNPQFNRDALEEILRDCGVRYLYLGGSLGGRGGTGDYDSRGVVDYRKLRRNARFAGGCRQVRELLAEKETPALMCSEKDPLTCHRALLIAPALREDAEIWHILANGELQSHADLEKQLLALHPPPPPNLFAPRQSGVGEAYRRQAARFGHRRKTAAAGGK